MTLITRTIYSYKSLSVEHNLNRYKTKVSHQIQIDNIQENFCRNITTHWNTIKYTYIKLSEAKNKLQYSKYNTVEYRTTYLVERASAIDIKNNKKKETQLKTSKKSKG